jgi:hypothetical protein
VNVFGDNALDWLLDVGRPLLIEDASWKRKQEQLRALPKWFYEPEPHVRDFLLALRGEGPTPGIIDDELWEDVRRHIEGDPDDPINRPGDFIAFLWFFTFYKNRDGRRRKELATPTSPQLAWAWRFMVLVDAGVPVRIDLLKTRQGGFSWVIAQAVLWILCTRKNIGALCVAHEKVASQRIFTYLKDGHEWLPDEVRPQKEHSSKNELFLRNPIEAERQEGDVGQDSIALVQTAGTDFVGTAVALQAAWVSEIGKWHVVCDEEQTYTSMVNTIQDEPGTFVLRESTAFGADTFWHRECKSSLQMGQPGWNGFTLCFFPWYFDERNRAKAPPELEHELGDRDDAEFGNERALREHFGLDLDQVWWRRLTIRKQAETRSKIELFNQEHPSTFAMAWLYAFGRWIEPSLITIIETRLHDEEQRGLLRPLFVGDLVPLRERGIEAMLLRATEQENAFFRRRRYGPLTIYRLPDWRFDYVVGGDVSEGDGEDHSCLKGYQRLGADRDDGRNMRLAFEWYGLIEPDGLADLMWRLGHLYSTGRGGNRFPALLAWERTGSGHGIGKWLRLGARGRDSSDAYPASRMYRRHDPASKHFSQDSFYGIQTSSSTKPVIMSEFARAVRDGHLQLTREDVVELQSITRNERGLLVTNGRDRIMAAAMANYATLFSVPAHGVDDPKRDEPPEHSVQWAVRIAKRPHRTDIEDSYEEPIT